MIVVKTKSWGNSLGVIIPREVVQAQHLRPNQEIEIIVRPVKTPLQHLFGTLKFDKPTDQLLAEYRKENKFSKWIE